MSKVSVFLIVKSVRVILDYIAKRMDLSIYIARMLAHIAHAYVRADICGYIVFSSAHKSVQRLQ